MDKLNVYNAACKNTLKVLQDFLTLLMPQQLMDYLHAILNGKEASLTIIQAISSIVKPSQNSTPLSILRSYCTTIKDFLLKITHLTGSIKQISQNNPNTIGEIITSLINLTYEKPAIYLLRANVEEYEKIMKGNKLYILMQIAIIFGISAYGYEESMRFTPEFKKIEKIIHSELKLNEAPLASDSITFYEGLLSAFLSILSLSDYTVQYYGAEVTLDYVIRLICMVGNSSNIDMLKQYTAIYPESMLIKVAINVLASLKIAKHKAICCKLLCSIFTASSDIEVIIPELSATKLCQISLEQLIAMVWASNGVRGNQETAEKLIKLIFHSSKRASSLLCIMLFSSIVKYNMHALRILEECTSQISSGFYVPHYEPTELSTKVENWMKLIESIVVINAEYRLTNSWTMINLLVRMQVGKNSKSKSRILSMARIIINHHISSVQPNAYNLITEYDGSLITYVETLRLIHSQIKNGIDAGIRYDYNVEVNSNNISLEQTNTTLFEYLHGYFSVEMIQKRNQFVNTVFQIIESCELKEVTYPMLFHRLSRDLESLFKAKHFLQIEVEKLTSNLVTMIKDKPNYSIYSLELEENAQQFPVSLLDFYRQCVSIIIMSSTDGILSTIKWTELISRLIQNKDTAIVGLDIIDGIEALPQCSAYSNINLLIMNDLPDIMSYCIFPNKELNTRAMDITSKMVQELHNSQDADKTALMMRCKKAIFKLLESALPGIQKVDISFLLFDLRFLIKTYAPLLQLDCTDVCKLWLLLYPLTISEDLTVIQLISLILAEISSECAADVLKLIEQIIPNVANQNAKLSLLRMFKKVSTYAKPGNADVYSSIYSVISQQFNNSSDIKECEYYIGMLQQLSTVVSLGCVVSSIAIWPAVKVWSDMSRSEALDIIRYAITKKADFNNYEKSKIEEALNSVSNGSNEETKKMASEYRSQLYN